MKSTNTHTHICENFKIELNPSPCITRDGEVFICVVDCLKMKLQDGTSKDNDKESGHVYRIKTKWFANRMAVILIRIKRKKNEKNCVFCFHCSWKNGLCREATATSA